MWALASGCLGSAVGLWDSSLSLYEAIAFSFPSQHRILLRECVTTYSAGDAYLDSFEFGAVVCNTVGNVPVQSR